MIDDFIVPLCLEPLELLYQDDDILLIHKPSGLLSLSGKHPLNGDSVHRRLVSGRNGLNHAFPEAKLPHRLDFGTSGVMLVGLNTYTTKQLNQQFSARTVQKRYIAMLDGELEHDHGEIDAPIAKDKLNFPQVRICEQEGKPALSEYVRLKHFQQPSRSLVAFTPLTGRTHQLRIHSLVLGHPILGCDLYKNSHSEQLAPRLMLHASDLYFDHPSSGERMHGHSPCPFN